MPKQSQDVEFGSLNMILTVTALKSFLGSPLP